MKTPAFLLLALVLGLAPVQPAQTQPAEPVPATPASAAPPAPDPAVPPDAPTAVPSPLPASAPTETPAASSAPGTPQEEPPPQPANPDSLRLNFRGAPLELVLNYMAEAAGFVIVLETEVRGKVDVWSNQPLDRDEAVALLNSVLNRNGYAAIRNDRTLTIISREDARKRDVPVRSGNRPEDIPRNDEVVTQIIPVRFINAVQLIKDLQPLLPEKSTLTANEGGNAIVITDTQLNIRRLTEIVKALDTAISSVSTVRVFALRYADAKALATVLKEVFQSADASQRGDVRTQILNRFRGFGGGNAPGGDGAGGESAGSGGRSGAARVTAVADERSNALVVGAPDELIPTIEEVVKAVDAPVEDVTEVRVFRLRFADPVEMAELLTNLFPDETRSDDSRSPVRFGGGPQGMGRGNNASTGNAASDRMKKQGRVIAVPDQRTSSVVVSAARELMDQIGQMVSQLDENPAKRQKVFVYSLENADVQSVEEILQGLFESQNSRNTRSTTSQGANPLNTRSTANQNSGTSLGNSFGSQNQGGQTLR